MTPGTIYRLPSGQLAECVKVSDDLADFRYLNTTPDARHSHEVALTRVHWAKLVRVG